MKVPRTTWVLLTKIGLACLGLALVGASITAVRTWLKPGAAGGPSEHDRPRLIRSDMLLLPPESARSMGILGADGQMQTVEARYPLRPPQLPPLQGTLALDNSRLGRVNSRFTGEVVEIADTLEEPLRDLSLPELKRFLGSYPGLAGLFRRPLRFGDKVERGQLLAVVWSKDLGEKKSELVDALSQANLDRETLKNLEEIVEQGAIPLARIREARRNVQASANAVAKVERTLEAWRLSREEIASIRAEAERLIRERKVASFDPSWARVELRAPKAGTILEKNLNVGDIVDPTQNLFKIADLSRLTVWAHIYEEDLVTLNRLPLPLAWTIKLKADPDAPAMPGAVDTIGSIIDPVQHTALLTGTVENPDGKLRPGQFVTATIQLPRADDEVQIPDSALEESEGSVVFVQPDPDKLEFTMRAVAVSRRAGGVVHVRSHLTAAERHGRGGVLLSPLLPGERVVAHGVNHLRQTLENLRNTNGKTASAD